MWFFKGKRWELEGKAEDRNLPRVDVVGGELAGDGSAVEFAWSEGGHYSRPVWC
jgi:hypothetical protein